MKRVSQATKGSKPARMTRLGGKAFKGGSKGNGGSRVGQIKKGKGY